VQGRNISWLDSRDDPTSPEVYGCRLDRRHRTCAAIALSEGFTTTLAPASAAGRFFWSDGRSGDLDVRACEPLGRGAGCTPYDPIATPDRRGFVNTDGRSLSWLGTGARFGFCDVDPRSGTCDPRTTADPILALSRPAYSRGLLAWVGFDFRGNHPLEVCEVDPTTGACAPIRVTTGVSDGEPKLSGNRLVWDGLPPDASGSQGSDVFFCEVDRVLGVCPVQRITANLAFQGASDVDGDWVVWQDARAGASEIRALELPRLLPLRDRRVREGRLLRIPVRSTGGRKRPPVWLDAEAVGHESLASIGARFVAKRDGTGWLLWRPKPGQAGAYAFTFSGTTEAGLTTRRTIRVDVSPHYRRGADLRFGSDLPRGIKKRWGSGLAPAQPAGTRRGAPAPAR
jgi:hypothetical protein